MCFSTPSSKEQEDGRYSGFRQQEYIYPQGGRPKKRDKGKSVK